MNVGDGFLRHYGILGMKWGIRRYQNPDGSLTEKGRADYPIIVLNPKAALTPVEIQIDTGDEVVTKKAR